MKPIQLIKFLVAASASGLLLAGCITAKPMVAAEPVAAAPAPPPPAPAPPAPELILRLHSPQFAFDSAKLTSEDTAQLDGAASKMKEHPTHSFEIAGNTDSIGTDAYNMGLGERRATAVHNYLVQAGVPADKMEVVSYGETKPIASNKTKEGRAENRRVDVMDLGVK